MGVGGFQRGSVEMKLGRGGEFTFQKPGGDDLIDH